MDAESVERIERLLGLILLHDLRDAPQVDKAVQLSRAGFAHAEIAALLGTTAQVVAQQLYLQRNRKAKPSKRKAKKKK
jgi:hypothetical protein